MTAKVAAINAGIITKEEADHRNVCMTAEELRSVVGEVQKTKGTEGQDLYSFEHKDKLEKILPKLRVLARSTPEDKYCIVDGLQKMGSVVAVTGESHNDA